jgi:hypothetical protein
MSDTQFKATLEMLIPLVSKEIIKSRNVNEQEAFDKTYGRACDYGGYRFAYRGC